MILLTKKENRIITKLNEAILLNVDPIEFSYYNGVELGLIYSLLQNSFEKLELNESLINQISSITKNLFPIKTSDLGPKYHGKEIGNKLNELEFKWIKSKFKLSKAQLLRMI
jgi:poly(A) polymerase